MFTKLQGTVEDVKVIATNYEKATALGKACINMTLENARGSHIQIDAFEAIADALAATVKHGDYITCQFKIKSEIGAIKESGTGRTLLHSDGRPIMTTYHRFYIGGFGDIKINGKPIKANKCAVCGRSLKNVKWIGSTCKHKALK